MQGDSGYYSGWIQKADNPLMSTDDHDHTEDNDKEDR